MPLEKPLKAKRFKNYAESVGDGFLLLWQTPATPTLYVTELELERHDVDRHILLQLGNFISFIQSAGTEERRQIRGLLYEELRRHKSVFDRIRKETGKEVLELLDHALDDVQILLVIDHMRPELSLGLSQIEKAINVKI